MDQSKAFLDYIPYEDEYQEKYSLIAEIGKGTYSDVDLVKRKKAPIKYSVIKRTKSFSTKKRQKGSTWLREYNIIKMLNHPNIIKADRLFQYYLYGEKIYCLEMEYFKGVDLGVFIRNKKKNGPYLISKEYLESMTDGILKGVDYLHSNKIVHRDLKPDNVLWNLKDQTIKIIDFGFAGYYDQPNNKVVDYQLYLADHLKHMGTPLYMSRESLHWQNPDLKINDRKDLVQVDIWAIGVILYYLSMGVEPFSAKTYPEYKKMMINPRYQEMNQNISQKVRLVIKKCLNIDPVLRGTTKDLISIWY